MKKGNSYRKTIRFNPEYDFDIIEKMKQYTDRNLSKLLRKFIRDGFKLESATLSALPNKKSDIINQEKKLETKKEIPKWNFPK